MKIEQDYLKKLLEAGQASEKPTFDIEDLKAAGFDYNDPQFEFHMMMLTRQGFIEQDDGSPGFGLTKSLDGSFSQWSVLPLRLTSSGHQFIEALSNTKVWATIKRRYPDASIATLKIVSQKLLEDYAQKDTVQAKALRMLEVIYEHTKSKEGGIDIEKVRELLGLSPEDARAGWTYLKDQSLITPFSIPTFARINSRGVDAIEAAQSEPDEPTSIFPSATYNTINVHHMVSSTIQQGGAGASITTTYSVEAVENLGKLVAVFESRLGELRLDEAKVRAARTQVATIKVQLADHPDPVIVNQAGRTLRNITEGAIGSLVATAAEPGIWHWVQHVMALFGP